MDVIAISICDFVLWADAEQDTANLPPPALQPDSTDVGPDEAEHLLQPSMRHGEGRARSALVATPGPGWWRKQKAWCGVPACSL
jgi:hypothetical protein